MYEYIGMVPYENVGVAVDDTKMLDQKRVLYVMRERSSRERTNTSGEAVMFGSPSRSYTLMIKPDTELGTVCRC
jgi:hypothetical protein